MCTLYIQLIFLYLYKAYMSLPLRLQGEGTCSWITLTLVCHKLACITFSTDKLQDFYNQSLQGEHSAIVRHNTNFAIVHSRVTVGDSWVKYEYKLLCQFTTMVGAIYGSNRARETHRRATRSVHLNAFKCYGTIKVWAIVWFLASAAT